MFIECKNYPSCYKEAICPDCDGCSTCCNCSDEKNKRNNSNKIIPNREKYKKEKTQIKSFRKGDY